MKSRLIKILILSLIIILTILTFPFRKESSDELVFWTLQMHDFAPYMNEVISNFEAENPEIKIKWIDVPFSEGEKRTLASVLSDNPPDLINLNPDFSALLAERGALWEIDETHTQQFKKSIINSLKYNGKLYSLPWYATSAVTIYNKELFKGFKVPSNYQDIEKVAPKIKEKNAYVFLPNITENDTMLRILNKYGVTMDNINSEASVEVFEIFKRLYEKDLIPKESITQTHREALEKYMAEQVAMFQAGANFLNMIKENAPLVYKNTDVSAQLTGKIGQNDFSLMNFVIPLKAKHKNEALKFALYLTNYENQLELAKLTNILAVNQQALDNEFYTTYNNSDLMAKARVISARQLNSVEPAIKTERNQKDINTLINTAVQQVLLGKHSTKNVLDEVKQKSQDLQ